MKKVQILMSTYNGEKFLDEQLKSIISQTHANISILVRDDGSIDDTQDILNKWQQKSNLKWYQGQNLGVSASFMDLISNAESADFYAFSDQDDVWDSDKIEQAVFVLENKPVEIPILYCSAYRLVDENLVPLKIQYDNLLIIRPSFGNSLVSNIAAGCTCVFNRKVIDMIRIKHPDQINYHDLFIYQFVMALGEIYYDYTPRICYRQHSDNVIGGGKSLIRKTISRFKKYNIKEHMNIRLKVATSFYKTYVDDFKENDRILIEKFIGYKSSLLHRIRLVKEPSIYMNSKIDNILLRVFILAGKV